MKEQILSAIDDINNITNITTYSEDNIKIAIVLRLLGLLSWNIYHTGEVFTKYPTNSGKVDIALIVNNIPKIFIEIKPPHISLNWYQTRLLEIASSASVSLAILTNGLQWRFYLITDDELFPDSHFQEINRASSTTHTRCIK
jgi:hypothetical protein